MKIEITNQQKIKRLNLKQIKASLAKVVKLLGISSRSLSILFCDNKQIKKLNRKFLAKNSVTDVIAFSLDDDFDADYLGEVVVSVERAVQVSRRYNNTWQQELTLYLIHGILHLLGYSDKTAAKRKQMEKKQNQILTNIL